MNTPPFLLAAALLLWGGQLGLLWLGGLIGLILELSRWLPWRWVLEDKLLRRTGLLISFLLFGLMGAGVILARNQDIAFGILVWASWLPVAVLPALLVQAWGTDPQGKPLDLSRLLHRTSVIRFPASLDWPFFALCLLSASFVPGTHDSQRFYACFGLLLTWGLWQQRPRHYRPVYFLLAGLLAWGGALLAHQGLHWLQGEVESQFGEWFLGDDNAGDSDPGRSSTAIGRIGELKQSSKIVLRVRSNRPLATPFLLQDATYTTYVSSAWLARDAAFAPLASSDEGNASLALSGKPLPADYLQLAYTLKRGQGLLLLPAGAVQLSHLPIANLEKNRLGAVTLKNGPERIAYQVNFLRAANRDAGPPTVLDRQLPPQLLGTLKNLSQRLQLPAQSPQQAGQTVQDYFQKNFRYSLYQSAPEGNTSMLEDFLVRTHAGHCEYFATATVLLLRQSGIPARYATGYSVHEYSELEKAYLVRSRHAHAWAQIYYQGSWHDLDTTPSRWAEMEDAQQPVWQRMADGFSWVWDVLRQWWAAFSFSASLWYGLLGLLPLYFIWRLARLKRVNKTAQREAPQPMHGGSGLDSAWYAFEKRLNAAGLERFPWEPLEKWAERIRPFLQQGEVALNQAIHLHYRYRFDSAGISEEEKQQLCTCLDKVVLVASNPD